MENKAKEIEYLVNRLRMTTDEGEIIDLLQKEGFYPAWHMNKKYWISITLNDIVDDKLLFKLVDESYSYSEKK